MTAKDWILQWVNLSREELYDKYAEFIRDTNSKMDFDTYKRYVRKLTKLSKNNGFGVVSRTVEKDSITETILSPENYKTIDDVAKFSDIDTDVWYPNRITTNRWNTGETVC